MNKIMGNIFTCSTSPLPNYDDGQCAICHQPHVTKSQPESAGM